jgi:serine protease inhibitor
LLSHLYICSAGTTEIDLQTYLKLNKKNLLQTSLNSFNNLINNTNNNTNNKAITMKNCIIIGNNVPHVKTNLFSNKIIIVDIDNEETEAEKINNYITKATNGALTKTLRPENLTNLQVMFLTAISIKPLWDIPFDKVIKKNYTNYLCAIEKTYRYFEDSDYQAIEIPCNNNIFSFGIIINKPDKNNNIFSYDNEKIKFYIDNFKETNLSIVEIPVMTMCTKLRFNNILKNTGLQTPFIKIIAPLLLPEHAVIHDVIQHASVVLDNTTSVKNMKCNGYKNIRKFIVNRPFFYYFRLNQHNVIMLYGNNL